MAIINKIPRAFAKVLKHDQIRHIIRIGLNRDVCMSDIDDLVTDYHVGHRSKVRLILKHFTEDDIDSINIILRDYRGYRFSDVRISIDGDRLIIH